MIRFSVLGEPVPKGSHAGFVRERMKDGKLVAEAVVVDANRRSKHKDEAIRKARNRWLGKGPGSWMACVTNEAFAARVLAGKVPRGALNVAAVFYMRRPKNRMPGTPCTTAPDLDKLLRGLLDPMVKAGLIIDDSWVCSFDGCRKLYDDGGGPRTEVQVSEVSWGFGPLLR
jgi:Holliday junction resolvase RusA-like endonuclease